MVRDVWGSEWSFIRFQNLDCVAESLEWFWIAPKLTMDYLCVALCVDMLLLCFNNMLCCSCDSLGQFQDGLSNCLLAHVGSFWCYCYE